MNRGPEQQETRIDVGEDRSSAISTPISTRREFGRKSLAALAVAGLGSGLPQWVTANAAEAGGTQPDSNVAGVQLGINVPYSFAAPAMSGEDILRHCVDLGFSAVELRTQPVEAYLGGPKNLYTNATREERVRWRAAVSMDRVKAFRKMYETAGVLIQIVKVDGIFGMADEELDYIFQLARTLGARAISTEIAHQDKDLQRLGGFADKHELMVGYHGHAGTKPADWERAFSFAKFNGANVDLGHFVAGNNISPVPFIAQYHDRVTHVHLKDRKMHDGPNRPFGEGDTPIKEVLHLIRDNHWNIQGTVEFEYPVPPGSTRMKEIARALKYCREALES